MGGLPARSSRRGIEWMRGGVDVDPWRDLKFLANGDRVAVEKDAVVVDEATRPDRDVRAVVAAQRRLHDGTFAEVSEKLAENARLPVGVVAL